MTTAGRSDAENAAVSAPDFEARAKAISSPLRLRILRLCLHQERTNKELADLLGVNPGTMLHHVRSLVDTGFLAAGDVRRGTRGAREVPYRATRLSWRHPATPDVGSIMIQTFLQEIEGVPADDITASRLGLKLTPEHREELLDRFDALLQEYAAKEPDPDGIPISLLFVQHPDTTNS